VWKGRGGWLRDGNNLLQKQDLQLNCVNLCSSWHYTLETLWGAAIHILGTTDLSQDKMMIARKVLIFTLFFAGYMSLFLKVLYHVAYSNNVSVYCAFCFRLYGTLVVMAVPVIFLRQYPIAFMASTLKRICEWQPSLPHCLLYLNRNY
jgi:hypothetical protein